MKFLEKDLEDIIWESDNIKLRKRGLSITGIKKRQLKIGNYGISDLVTFSKYINEFDGEFSNGIIVTVYELKKEKAGISAFLQALRYCKGIKTYLDKRKPNINVFFKIVLVAKEIDTDSDYIFLTDFINYELEDGCLFSVENYSFKYDIDGITFKSHSEYNLIDKGF